MKDVSQLKWVTKPMLDALLILEMFQTNISAQHFLVDETYERYHYYKALSNQWKLNKIIPRAVHAQLATLTIRAIESLSVLGILPHTSVERRASRLLARYTLADIEAVLRKANDRTFCWEWLCFPSIDSLRGQFSAPARELETFLKRAEAHLNQHVDVFQELIRGFNGLWLSLKSVRHKTSHNFAFFIAGKIGADQELPDGCDDILFTLEKSLKDPVESAFRMPIPLGDKPAQAMASAARQALIIQRDIILNLRNQLRNKGERTWPYSLFTKKRIDLPSFVDEKLASLPNIVNQLNLSIETNMLQLAPFDEYIRIASQYSS